MNKLLSKYRSLSFEERMVAFSKLSIIFNAILAIAKIVLSYFFGVFFFVAGLINVFIMISKMECYVGIKYPNKKTFKYRNLMTGLFLILAGVQYAIYMGRMLYSDVELMQYNGFLAINIALVSFIEITIAIIGCFKVYGRGHYFRNLKIINLASAATAIALTEVALMSFASDMDTRLIDGLFCLVVGLIIVIFGAFILIAPKISIVDREHNVYKATKALESPLEIKLTNSKFYGDYYYVAKVDGDIVDGHIIQKKSPIFKWNIYLKIGVIVFSEILIFPYAVGAVVYYFQNHNLISRLDNKMTELGCIKLERED